MSEEYNKNSLDEGYNTGVSIHYGRRVWNFSDTDNRFAVLDVMKPHIGYRSALLLELLGYQKLPDLARSGFHLAAIPSIGPKKTEKIISVLEGFGLRPPRRPDSPPKHWRNLFNHFGQ